MSVPTIEGADHPQFGSVDENVTPPPIRVMEGKRINFGVIATRSCGMSLTAPLSNGGYAYEVARDRYVRAALSVGGVVQPQLGELANHLADMDAARLREKGRLMTDDHLRQEAVKWVRTDK